RLHIFVDRSSVEVFGNDGQVVFTEQIFPADDSLGLELFVDGGQVQLNALDIYQLDPAAFFISGESQSQVTEPVATSES
ncbi:MAG: GH32 C-terminal domain-containing protein, partial [Chloroflexi bacterium]|nr:GH32 C-terminal domain-containing protein [Chloroflexota bacterium]